MSTAVSTSYAINKPSISIASGRIASLDSLRGLAALSVVVWHIATMFPFSSDPWFARTPFHIFGDGEEAVAIFFALSGFVLMLPYLNLRDTDDSSRKESCAYIRPCGRS